MCARAIDSEDKAARRAEILSAARRLFLHDSRQLPSVAQIATEAGLAKGTVYLYFQTKEEIFFALLNEYFAGLLQAVHAVFEAAASDDVLTRFMTCYVAYLDACPELLRLDAMAYSVLERNLDDAILRKFKLELLQGLMATAALIEARLGLSAGRGLTLLMRTYALTRGLWQSLDYPPNLKLLPADPVFAPIRPDFRTELTAAVGEYWRGALAS